MLKIKQLESGYGKSQVLFDMNLEVARGQAVSMVGRNGMGKSTTIKCIMGMLPIRGAPFTLKIRTSLNSNLSKLLS